MASPRNCQRASWPAPADHRMGKLSLWLLERMPVAITRGLVAITRTVGAVLKGI